MRIVVLIGMPGSGKGFYAKSLVGDKIILSADDYFTDKNGNYNWTPEKAHLGHEDCLRKFIYHITYYNSELSDFALVVDNTNLRLWDVSPYIRIAQAYGFVPQVKFMDTDIELAKSRNTHGVPDEVYERMQGDLDDLLLIWPKDFPVIDYIEGVDDRKYQRRDYPTNSIGLCMLSAF
jgi:predicted kinase